MVSLDPGEAQVVAIAMVVAVTQIDSPVEGQVQVLSLEVDDTLNYHPEAVLQQLLARLLTLTAQAGLLMVVQGRNWEALMSQVVQQYSLIGL